MQPFVLDSRGRLVFPSNFLPSLDFSAIDTLEQLHDVIRRDFDTKAPRGTDIVDRVEAGHYATRYQLLRDVALHLFWANRFAMTMYEKRPTRWRDVPRTRDDVFLPVLQPWEDADRKVAAVATALAELPAAYDDEAEHRIEGVLLEALRHKRFHATELPAVKPTVARILEQPDALTYRLTSYDPDYPVYSYRQMLDCAEDVPELEALHRWAMVLHNQYPWQREATELARVGDLRDDDYVVVFHPRSRDVLGFIDRAEGRQSITATTGGFSTTSDVEAVPPVRPYPAVRVRERFAVRPRLEALAIVKGEQPCTNEDLIRNAAYSWSPMTADDIATKTGIEQRTYTCRPLEDLALEACRAALAHAGRGPAEVGAVLFCTCTSNRLMPSVATWLSGQLGIAQTHASCDIVAACAGLPYGMSEAVRLLQEVERPVLLVCGEKFSDKIGTVRPSRMIFGDGAAAMVLAPAPEGEAPDVEVLNTYASGPVSQVNSIVWPNPQFDNNLTVYGPEVRTLAGRYLVQMMQELQSEPDPDGVAANLLDSIDLCVPHQANKTMVVKLALDAGLSEDRLYFNIDRVGNVSAASIPIAIADAVRDGVIKEPVRVFAPGFGAGAVGGYAVLRIDPAVVAEGGDVGEARPAVLGGTSPDDPPTRDDGTAERPPSGDVITAFGG